MIPTFTVQATKCPKCGHQHAGRELAFICVGCPCPERPGSDDYQGDETVNPPTSVTKAAVISVSTKVLEAVAQWTSADKTRLHLHQVFFSKGAMVAADGHRMVIVPCETFGLTVGINRQYLLAAVAAQRSLGDSRITIARVDTDPSLLRLGLDHSAAKISVIVPAADTDKFPPYEQVVRDSERTRSESPAGYAINPRYLAAIAEVNEATCDADGIASSDRGVKVTAWSEDRLGAMVFVNQVGVKFLVMPMRI